MDPLQHLAQRLASSPLKQADIELVCSHFRVAQFERETLVATQGRTYGKLVYVAEGILRVFVVTPDGEEVVKNFVEEGEFFADPESFGKDVPAGVSLATVTACTLLTLSKVEGARLARALPTWPALMQEGALHAMRAMIRKQEFLLLGSAADQYDHFARHFPNLIQRVPLKYVASYLRVTQSSLSRLRKQRARPQFAK